MACLSGKGHGENLSITNLLAAKPLKVEDIETQTWAIFFLKMSVEIVLLNMKQEK